MSIVQDLAELDGLIARGEGRPLPWTCTACNTPCELVLDDATFKFRSACCNAVVEPTKARAQDADTA